MAKWRKDAAEKTKAVEKIWHHTNPKIIEEMLNWQCEGIAKDEQGKYPESIKVKDAEDCLAKWIVDTCVEPLRTRLTEETVIESNLDTLAELGRLIREGEKRAQQKESHSSYRVELALQRLYNELYQKLYKDQPGKEAQEEFGSEITERRKKIEGPKGDGEEDEDWDTGD
jgi:hypothetical protein